MDYLYKRPKKRSVAKYIVITILLIIISGFFSLLWLGYNLTLVRGQAVSEFEIRPGEGVNEVSFNLLARGAIRSKLAFESYLYLSNLESQLQAGLYELPASNIINLTRILLTGPSPAETQVTLIEGWTLTVMAEELAASGLVNRQEFLDIVQHPVASGITEENFPILYSKPLNVDLEGYLFPDTYRIFKEATSTQIVGLLINTLTSKISQQMALDIDNQGKTFHEILTMASIVEKEVGTDRDRRLVSGVLWQRLAQGIPLQVDATINYITGENKPAVSLAETRIDNPFNTYLYRGLPPGPIANPSLSSIMAAIYPTGSDYLFYLSTPEGETIFSQTLDQHNEAKARYLK